MNNTFCRLLSCPFKHSSYLGTDFLCNPSVINQYGYRRNNVSCIFIDSNKKIRFKRNIEQWDSLFIETNEIKIISALIKHMENEKVT